MKKEKSIFIKSGSKEYSFDPSKKETTPGIFVAAGDISEDFDKVSWKELLEDYTNMRNGGAVESTTISILKYPILGAGYTINHKDSRVVDYMQWCFNYLVDSFGDKDGFNEFLSHLFLALDFGCSFFEKVYENGVYADGKITNVIKRLSPFKLETIWEFHYDDEMQFSGIRHERRQASRINSFVDIPVEKLFFYSHNAEFGDPRGRSELRPVRNLYKIKKEILLATARAQQRGAGIPEIKFLKSGATEEEKARAREVGKTIGNMKSGYVITDQNMELKLHGLQALGSPEATLEFINRELFFNTLTEFMASGIGQNGSRAATSEHKSSYELKCGAVMSAVEKRINLLMREMCEISYLGSLDEYPTFKFNSLTQTDIMGAADAINKFYASSVLTKQDGDEKFIRGMFNLPEKIEVKEGPVKKPEQKEKSEEEIEEEVLPINKKMDISFARKLSAEENSAFIGKVFDVEKAESAYVTLQKGAEAIIDDVMKKYILYIGRQIDSGNPVEMKYDVELVNRLNKLYNDGFGIGAEAVVSEIDKISDGKEFSNKAIDPIKAASKSIQRFASRLLNNIKTVVEDSLDTEWVKDWKSATDFIEDKKFNEGFKTDRRTLIEKTTDGYMDGRATMLDHFMDNIDLYLYNSIMDKNLCEVCAGLTGSIFTLEEARLAGLLVGRGKGRVNLNCRGSILRCRCNLVPYKLKRGK